ncbi:VOC family protein [Pseudaquabacterium terrae]|uniref:VOC family protein n=1 Tax=Pseudaquabacterium terrae TaxID=2732868 RepID=UPI0031B5D089
MTTTTLNNAANWFEIPVRDLDRAQAFYEKLLAKALRREAMGPQTLAVIPYDQAGVGGALLAGDHIPDPSPNGTLVYLNAEPSLDSAVERAVAAGGRIATPRVELPEGMGCFAHVIDSEGNRVGLHALR